MRPSELFPEILIDELLRLARLDRDWCYWTGLADNTYSCNAKFPTFLRKLWKSGADAFAMKATSIWLVDGPKVFKPTKEQCLALEHVNVNLLLEDYTQPYPAILIQLDYPPFTNVLCYKEEKILVCVLHTGDHLNDITTTVARTDCFVEDSLVKFDEDCKADAKTAAAALRVACNACLALSNYGCHAKYLFPKEAERDRRLAKESTDRGKRAKDRLRLAVQELTLDHVVTLHETSQHGTSELTAREGYSVSTHWRRGHWTMQCHGPGNSLRKRIFRRPILVRGDLLANDAFPPEVTTVYKTAR